MIIASKMEMEQRKIKRSVESYLKKTGSEIKIMWRHISKEKQVQILKEHFDYLFRDIDFNKLMED